MDIVKFGMIVMAALAVMFAFGYFRMKDRYEVVSADYKQSCSDHERRCIILKNAERNAVSAKTRLEKMCNKHGICTVCGSMFSHDIDEPFASCKCGTAEWYTLTPYMLLEQKIYNLRNYIAALNASFKYGSNDQIVEGIVKHNANLTWRKTNNTNSMGQTGYEPVLTMNGIPCPALLNIHLLYDVPEYCQEFASPAVTDEVEDDAGTSDQTIELDSLRGPGGPAGGNFFNAEGGPGPVGAKSPDYEGEGTQGRTVSPTSTHEDNAKSFFDNQEFSRTVRVDTTTVHSDPSPSPSPSPDYSSSSSGGTSGCD